MILFLSFYRWKTCPSSHVESLEKPWFNPEPELFTTLPGKTYNIYQPPGQTATSFRKWHDQSSREIIDSKSEENETCESGVSSQTLQTQYKPSQKILITHKVSVALGKHMNYKIWQSRFLHRLVIRERKKKKKNIHVMVSSMANCVSITPDLSAPRGISYR